jgi:Arf-GAP/coiled-coil/ANK repeat/PH domain-containing protein
MVLQGSVMAVEFLLLNGAKINVQDADGKTPLHLATVLGENIYIYIFFFFVLEGFCVGYCFC